MTSFDRPTDPDAPRLSAPGSGPDPTGGGSDPDLQPVAPRPGPLSPADVLALLRRLGHFTRGHQPAEDLIREIIRELPRLLQVRRVSLLLVQAAGSELAALAQVGLPREFRVIHDLDQAPMVRWVITHRQPLVVDDIATDPRFADTRPRAGYHGRAFVSLPLVDQDQVVGVLNLTERCDGGRFSPDEIETLDLFSDQLTTALRQTLLQEKLRRHEERLARANQELRERLREIRLLYRLGRSISSVFELDTLVRLIVKQLPTMLKVRRVSIVLRDPGTGKLYILESIGLDRHFQHRTFLKSAPVAELVIERRRPLLINDMAADPRFAGMVKEGYQTRAFISLPLFHKEEVVGVLSVSDRLDGSRFTDQDLKLLTIFGTQLGVTLANIRLVEALRRSDRLVEELRIARTIQTQFLPIILPERPGIDIAVKFQAAEEISGDFYTFVDCDDGGLAVIIGDVSGKGIPAALLTVLAITQFQELARMHPDPAEFMRHSHRILCRYSQANHYITAGLCRFAAGGRRFSYSLAGHLPIMHYQAATRTLTEWFEGGGLPLGMSPESDDYSSESVDVAPGDRLLIYTDGVTDAKDRNYTSIGRARLRETFLALAAGEHRPQAIVDGIHDRLTGFCTGVEPYDDLTLICIGIDDARPTTDRS